MEPLIVVGRVVSDSDVETFFQQFHSYQQQLPENERTERLFFCRNTFVVSPHLHQIQQRSESDDDEEEEEEEEENESKNNDDLDNAENPATNKVSTPIRLGKHMSSPFIKRVVFHKNEFIASGSAPKLDMSELSKDIEWLDFSANKLKTIPLPGYWDAAPSGASSSKYYKAPSLSVDLTSFSKMKVLDLSFNNLKVLLDLTQLPPVLEVLNLESNQFETKSPKLSKLPSTLKRLNLSRNQFCGDLDLTRLPNSMIRFLANRNMFTNTPNFSSLPSSLQVLEITHNKFSGTISSLSSGTLPLSLEIIDMTKCIKLEFGEKFLQIFDKSKIKIEGLDDDDDHQEEDASSLSASSQQQQQQQQHQLRRICAGGCKLKTTPSFASSSSLFSPSLEVLDFSNNAMTTPLRFSEKLPMWIRYIDFSGNQMKGPLPDLSLLPDCCRHIDFRGNHFTTPIIVKITSNDEDNDDNAVLSGFDIFKKKQQKSDNNNSTNSNSYDFFSKLPACLTFLDLSENSLTAFDNGKIDLTKLPKKMEHLDLSCNKIQSELIMYHHCDDDNEDTDSQQNQLPKHLERILLSDNKCFGTVDLQHLPHGFSKIDLSTNQFEDIAGGSKCFGNLPDSIDSIDLTSNIISIKDLDLSVLPENAEMKLFLGENNLCGKIDFKTCSNSLKQLYLNQNQLNFCGLDLADLAALDNLAILDLSDNQLNGKLLNEEVLHQEPKSASGNKKMRSYNLSGNNFETSTAAGRPENQDEEDGVFLQTDYFAVQF